MRPTRSQLRVALSAPKVSLLSIALALLVMVSLYLALPLFAFSSTSAAASAPALAPAMASEARKLEAKCPEPHFLPDGGDCSALRGQRRPSWACLSAMRESLPEFLRVYERRPERSNHGGMRMDHAFALWYVLRATRPGVVIESGAFRGQGTWLMRQALPNVRILSLDTVDPVRRLPGVEYITGRSFQDFASVDWAGVVLLPRTHSYFWMTTRARFGAFSRITSLSSFTDSLRRITTRTLAGII